MSDRTGTLETNRNADGRVYYRAKVRLKDGSRAGLEIPEAKRFSKTAARDFTAWAQENEDKTNEIYLAKLEGQRRREARSAGAAGETCDAWYERFKAYRRNEVGSVQDDAWRWERWIAPHIGGKPLRDVDADDVENIRDALTLAVIAYEAAGNVKGEGRLAPKTAQNVWAALTTPMKYASTRKGPRELRVREDKGNPCLGIPPPRNGASKSRHWLRPPEVLAVVSAPAVPREWREAIAIGCYLHLRPGELHELRVKDIDLVAGEVRISRAYDERKQAVKVPKTQDGIRPVTIPAALLPLLTRIARDGAAEDRVAPIVAATEEYYRAGLFRTFLKTAGVDRAELFVENATHLMIDFRSLRDSGITWRFLAGERVEVVQREAGHDQIVTTLAYAKEVQDRRGRYGEPFPTLPAELTGGDGDPPTAKTSTGGGGHPKNADGSMEKRSANGGGPKSGPPDSPKRSDAHLGVIASAARSRSEMAPDVSGSSVAGSCPARPTPFRETRRSNVSARVTCLERRAGASSMHANHSSKTAVAAHGARAPLAAHLHRHHSARVGGRLLRPVQRLGDQRDVRSRRGREAARLPLGVLRARA